MNKKAVLAIFSLLAVISILSACAAPPPTTVSTQAPAAAEEDWKSWKTIRVGVPTLITGPGAPMGTDIIAGASLAAENINNEGGILGKPIELVYSDLKATTAEDCTLGAEVMDNAGVVMYLGGPFWGPACIDDFGSRNGPLFHLSATKILVDKVRENNYTNIYQGCPSEAFYAENGFNVLTKVLPIQYDNKKVALLGGDTSYDTTIREAAKKRFADAGWEIILDDTYPYGTTEFGAQLAKIRSENPAIIFGVITSTDSSVAFINQFLENPTNSIIYIQWSPSSPEFIKNLGDKANGVVWQTLSAYLPTKENEEWVKDFQAMYGRMPGATWPSVVDDFLHIWKSAVESAGSPVAYDKINQYIAETKDHPYIGRNGTYVFDRGEALGGDDYIPMHFVQILDGADHVLYLGTKPVEGNEFQLPPWFTSE